jgi:flagellar assembly protein FliH
LPNTLAAQSFVVGGHAAVPAELVEAARGDARAVGYAQGWSQGQREAAEMHATALAEARAAQQRYVELRAQRLDSAMQALQVAAAGLSSTVVQLTDQISDKVLSAAVELATALLGQQLADPQVSAGAALNRVLAIAPDNEPVTVWLSPQDYQTVTEAGPEALIARYGAATAARITVECDPALTVGDAMARSAVTGIDARLTDAIGRLRDYVADDDERSLAEQEPA